jgi:hypothetical protein
MGPWGKGVSACSSAVVLYFIYNPFALRLLGPCTPALPIGQLYLLQAMCSTWHAFDVLEAVL